MSIRILQNARIYTGNPDKPWATALAIVNEKVIALDQPAMSFADLPGAQIENMDGALIIPGLTDAHIHLMWYAQSLPEINLRDCTRQGMLDLVAERAAKTPASKWIRGRGWDQNAWEDTRFPTAVELDRVSPNNPVALIAKSGHAITANSTALRIAGITAATEDPPFGKIGRDDHGAPDGTLFENATSLVLQKVPAATMTELVDLIDEAQNHLLKVGITGVHDVDGNPAFASFQELRRQNRQKVRIVKYIRMEALDGAISAGLRSGFGDGMLHFGGLKLFADGALGPRTGAMIEAYEGEPDNYGILTLEPGHLRSLVMTAAHAGIGSAVHAIGDRANRLVLDVLEQARQEVPHLRQRIEHVQTIHPEDQPRLARAGIVGSVQPIHGAHDQEMADRLLGKRAEDSYPWKTLLDYGTILAFGSDAPIEIFDPFANLYAAVTRRSDIDGIPGSGGWFPAQRISLEQALRAYTFGGAYAAGLEDQLGQLTPGYYADLAVLDRDIFALEPEALLETKVRRVMIAGLWQDI